MRKNDARKWLHAALDLLPVVLIPVFMVYSHRHNLTNGIPSANVEYKYITNDITDYNSLVNGNTYLLKGKVIYSSNLSNNTSWVQARYDEGYFERSAYPSNLSIFFSNDVSTLSFTTDCVFSCDDYYLGGFGWVTSSLTNTTRKFWSFGKSEYVNGYWFKLDTRDAQLREYYSNSPLYDSTLPLLNGSDNTFAFYTVDFDFVLTFYGNTSISVSSKTSIDNFISSGLLTSLPNDRNVITSAEISYEDSTITNVFLDNFCNTIDTYFNFGNVFNLGNVYSWVETNIFNGSAPQIVPAIWNIAVYEFVMDLIFLLYALFMFFIDFCVNLVDRFHTKCSGGK